MNIKTIFSIFLFSVCFLFQATAQYEVVKQTEKNMSFGSRPCFRLDFSNTDAGMVEDLWKDYVKGTFKNKLKHDRKSDEWTASELKSPMMGSDMFTIYSTIEKSGANAALNVWVDAGAYFLNRRDNAGRTDEFARSLRTFYYDVRRAAINAEIKAQEEQLKEIDSRQRKLGKENDSLHKDIEGYKSRIKKAESDIVKNEKDQESLLHDADKQRQVIEETKRRLSNVENERN
jgi:SMC interacting uncharacterized protein involved in chromosome segregation